MRAHWRKVFELEVTMDVIECVIYFINQLSCVDALIGNVIHEGFVDGTRKSSHENSVWSCMQMLVGFVSRVVMRMPPQLIERDSLGLLC